MKLLREKFLNKDAYYPTSYKDFVVRLTRVADVSKSLGTEEEKAGQGKAFATVYECFMYATMLGIKANYQVPIASGSRIAAGEKFLQIKFWKPEELSEYIFMSLLALSEFSFAELENLTEDEAEAKALELVKSMEFYAKGGFELMATKSEDVRHYFENAGNIVSFLQTMKPLGK